MIHDSDSSSKRMNRREFVLTGTAAGLAAATQAKPSAQAPAVTRARVKPVVISSANGYQYKNGGTKTCVETAFALMTEGKDVLDALIAGVNIVELDPLEDSVGYGGLPNAEGVVQLDSCCMHGPRRPPAESRAWRACALRPWWRRGSWTRPTIT
jgi:N4-(beta-N-acetylglucosaminyl)-L-asparaginase